MQKWRPTRAAWMPIIIYAAAVQPRDCCANSLVATLVIVLWCCLSTAMSSAAEGHLHMAHNINVQRAPAVKHVKSNMLQPLTTQSWSCCT